MHVQLLALGLLLQDPLPPSGTESGAAIVIDGHAIELEDFGRWLLLAHGDRLARDFALNHWVIDREARRLGVDPDPAEVETFVEHQLRTRIAGAFLGSADDWRAELARTGRSEGGLRRQRQVEARAELQSRNLAARDRIVPEPVIVREWELRHGRNGRSYDLQLLKVQVRVPSNPGATREEWKAERDRVIEQQRVRAQAFHERILAGEDVGALAVRYSDDVESRDRKGFLPGGFRHVGWPHAFLETLGKLEPGDILPPTFARGGWWVGKLHDVQVTPLEDVRAGLEADLLARGPEPFEIGMLQQRLAEGVSVRVLPAMHAEAADGEFPSAFDPVLEIDGEPVRRGEYARWILHTQGEILATAFAEEYLVEREAARGGITVDEREIAAYADDLLAIRLAETHRGSRESWLAYLALSGRTEEAWMRDLHRRARSLLLCERLILRDREVAPQDVRARFSELYGADGRRVEARLIQLRVRVADPGPDWTREELTRRMSEATEATRARAQELVTSLRAGQDFDTLARQHSEDPRTRDQGGMLPGFFRPDAWSEEIAQAVFGRRAGEVTDPILFGDSWMVFGVVSVRSATFEEVAGEIEQELRERRPLPAEGVMLRNVLLQKARVELQSGIWR